MFRKCLLFLAVAVLLAASGCVRPFIDPVPTDSANPGVSPGNTPALEEIDGVSVSQGDQTAAPYENFLWSSDYTENGWLAADGFPLIYLLPELALELPVLDRNAAFEIEVPENGKMGSFSVFDAAFVRTHHNISRAELPAALAAAPGNVCYVVFQVIYRGEYIPSEQKNENSCCEYAFALAWDDEPALSAWALESEDVAYIERFDDSQEPGTPSLIWASDEQVAGALAWLKDIELMEFVGLQNPAKETPGGSVRFLFHCFGFRTVSVYFVPGAVLTDRGYYTYAEKSIMPAVPPLLLRVSEPSYSYKTDEIPIALVNETGQTCGMAFVPVLERLSEECWAALPVLGGFCGTPDPFPPGVSDAGAVPLSLFEDVTPGIYRLSFLAADAEGKEYQICAILRLEELT